MTNENRALFEPQLRRYGLALSAADELVRLRDAKALGVFLSCKGPRAYAKMANGGKLWSGPKSSVGEFAARFWLLKPVSQ